MLLGRSISQYFRPHAAAVGPAVAVAVDSGTTELESVEPLPATGSLLSRFANVYLSMSTPAVVGRVGLNTIGATGTTLLLQASGVFRTISALGIIVADAVSNGKVGFAGENSLELRTTIVDDAGEVLCADDYTEDFFLESRDGLRLAQWKPLIFIGGIVLAETVRAAAAWLSERHGDALEGRIIQPCINAKLGAEAEEAAEKNAVPNVNISTAETNNQQLMFAKRLRQFAGLLSQGGSAAAGVAMSAELFRSGLSLMPYLGLNNMIVAEASTQTVDFQHAYQCPDTKVERFFTPGAQYDIAAELSLPEVVATNIEARALIELLFKIGLGVQALGQLLDKGTAAWQEKAAMQKLGAPFAQRCQDQGPQAGADWLASTLESYGCIAVGKKSIVAQNIVDALANPQYSQDSPASILAQMQLSTLPMNRARAESRALQLVDRLANTAVVASYGARLMTTGVPLISNGFNGLEAGDPIQLPINLSRDALWRGEIEGNLKIEGEAIIASSRLEGVMTNLFEPLVTSAAIAKMGTIVSKSIVDHGGLQKSATTFVQRPVATSAYFTAQMLLRAGQQGTSALGVLGLSLFLGARIAADLVGGSRVESSDLEGHFNFNATALRDGIPVAHRPLESTMFNSSVETIELPNPSQITGITMLVGGVGGSGLLLMSRGLVWLQHYLEQYAPQPADPALEISGPIQYPEIL